MSYSVLRTLKKEDAQKVDKKYVRHLVIGDDLFAVAHTLKLLGLNPEGGVGLLVEKKFSIEDLLPKGASSLRGEFNKTFLKETFPAAITTEYDRVARFIKESKFKKFGGRSKPETLLWGENFYVDPRVDMKLESIFEFLNDADLYSKLPTMEEKIVGIARADSDDMVENSKWSIKCASGTTFECEHLYFSHGPAAFLNLVSDKSILTNEFIEWCEATQTPATLNHHWSFSKPVIDRTDTIFLPFSYTHEWGHAIVEFVALENGGQEARMTCFVEPDQTNEEELSKKIRLYKRNLEKICPDASKFAQDEFLALYPTSVNEKNDDQGFQNCRDTVSNLHFIGMQGALENTNSEASHFARGLQILNASF